MIEEFWVLKIVCAIGVLIALNYALKFFLKYLHRRGIAKRTGLTADFESIFYFPFHVALWVIGIVYALEILGYRFNLWIQPTVLTNFRNALIIGCLTWITLRWKREIQKTFSSRILTQQMVFIFGRIGSILIFGIGGMTILQILGLDIMPLVAFGGIGAAAIGFASKDVIANFCSGLMLNITRPFTVGEWILLPDRGMEAIVEDIGWYLTAVRDKEKRPIYLPNSIFSQQLVINSSRMSHRRILEKIGIRYDDFAKVKALAEAIKKVAGENPRIDSHLPLLVYFTAFNDYSLDIQVDIYTLATRYEEYLAVKQEFLIKAYEVILAHGASIPFPTHTVLHHNPERP